MLDFVQERRRRIKPNVFVWGHGWRWVLLFYEEPLWFHSALPKTKKHTHIHTHTHTQTKLELSWFSISHIKLELEIQIVMVAELHFTHINRTGNPTILAFKTPPHQ
jgi:hypothetical protein